MRVLSVFAIALICIALVVAALVSAEPTPSNLPKWCNSINCPQFQTLKTCKTSAGTFSIRKYPQYEWSSWTTFGPGATAYNGVGGEAFHHLFDYISGQNAKNEKIAMTAPVTTDITSGAGPNCNSTFKTSFFIPYAFQGKAPTPTGQGVFLSNTTANRIVAVQEFSGYADNWDTQVLPQLKTLAASLAAAKISPMYNNQETVAQYDSPFRLFDRHNEVWFDIDSSAVSAAQCN